jgi:hypothetical protein
VDYSQDELPAGDDAPSSAASESTPRIDFHCHGIPRDFPRFADRYGDGWPEIVNDGPCRAEIRVDRAHYRTIDSRCWDAQRRLDDEEILVFNETAEALLGLRRSSVGAS